jgi:hypothetical protein
MEVKVFQKLGEADYTICYGTPVDKFEATVRISLFLLILFSA